MQKKKHSKRQTQGLSCTKHCITQQLMASLTLQFNFLPRIKADITRVCLSGVQLLFLFSFDAFSGIKIEPDFRLALSVSALR